MADEAAPGIVAAVGQRLAALKDRPVGDHIAAYEQVDRALQAELARLDEG